MAFKERIEVIFGLQSAGWKQGLANIRTDVAAAEGFFGKFKAGASGSFDLVKQNAGLMAVGAGAAITAFGVKAVSDFTNTAKAAVDLGAATGLSTEAASRWIAVGDDMGVTAEQLTTGIGRIGKELDSGKWEKYGIATRDASGKARGANDILLDTFDMLGKVTNETERAKIGNELFGRGYANLAPIIGKTRSEYQSMLSTVEDGQVVTAKEAQKAEKMRLAQDKLSDAFRELTLAVGEAVAGLAPLLDIVSPLVGGFGKLTGAVFASGEESQSLGERLVDLAVPIDDLIEKGDQLADVFREHHGVTADLQGGAEALTAALEEQAEQQRASERQAVLQARAFEDVNEKYDDLGAATKDATDAADEHYRKMGEVDAKYDDVAGVLPVVKTREEELADALQRVNDKLDAQQAKWDTLFGTLDAEQATLDLAQRFDDMGVSMDAAKTKFENGEITAEQYFRTVQEEQLKTKEQVATYAQEVLKLPPERVTTFLAQIDAGNFKAVEDALNILTRNRTMQLSIDLKGGIGLSLPGQPTQRAHGGPVTGGGIYEVNEGGAPETFNVGGRTYLLPGRSGHVSPIDGDDGAAGALVRSSPYPSSGSGGAAAVVNHFHFEGSVGVDGPAVERWITKVIKDYKRRGGVL